MTMFDFTKPDDPTTYIGQYRMLINTALNEKEYAAEATKELIAIFNFYLKHQKAIPQELSEFISGCFNRFVTGSSLDEAFNQKRGRGKPKDHSLHKRAYAVTLVVLQLHRGWLRQKDIDAIPVSYRPGMPISDFSARSLEDAYADAGALFAISESRAKQLYEDGCAVTPEILEIQSEEDMDIRVNPRILLATQATPEEIADGLTFRF